MKHGKLVDIIITIKMTERMDVFMNRKLKTVFALVIFIVFLPAASGLADFEFSDDRFRDDFSTANLDRIIEEYELYDGWYWTTEADIPQTFHGHPECPGWTTAVEDIQLTAYRKGWYGCRWPIDHVRSAAPQYGGYAECFAFAQFIGYLLSGDINPQHHWDFYYNFEASEGLRVGDIVSVGYTKNKHEYHHSAVVYAIYGDEILFLQVSGSSYNKIYVGYGFSDGNVFNARSLEELSGIPGIKISRYLPSEEKE